MVEPDSRPVVIFFHGRGQGPELAQEVAPAFRNASLLAPEGGVLLRRGHTWFQNRSVGDADPSSVAEAEVNFLAWADQQADPRFNRAWLCGFSNGGAFAGHLLMRHPHRFRGAALLCAPLVLPPWPADALRDKPVFYANGGVADTIVGPAFYAAAEAYLQGPSCSRSTITRYSTGHLISGEMVADLASWFIDVSQPRTMQTGVASA